MLFNEEWGEKSIEMVYHHLVPFKFPGMLMANGFAKGSFFPSKIFPRTNEFRNALSG